MKSKRGQYGNHLTGENVSTTVEHGGHGGSSVLYENEPMVRVITISDLKIREAFPGEAKDVVRYEGMFTSESFKEIDRLRQHATEALHILRFYPKSPGIDTKMLNTRAKTRFI